MAENPTPPVDPRNLAQAQLAATNKLIDLIESMRSNMMGHDMPNPQSRIDLQDHAAKVRTAVTGVTGIGTQDWANQQGIAARTSLGQGAGEVSPTASRPPQPQASASEIGPIELIRDMVREKKAKNPALDALRKPRKIPSYIPGSSSASRPDDEEESSPRRSSASMAPNAMGGGFAGGIDSQASPIAGMNNREFGELSSEENIPRFGEWKLDTRLKQIRNWAGEAAIKKAERDDDGNITGFSGRAKAYAGISAVANYGYAHAAKIQWAKEGYQKYARHTQNMIDQGAALGYGPNENPLGPSRILGFRNPLGIFSQAGKQGGGMNINALELSRFGTGLSTQQSGEIIGGLAGMGFSNQKAGFLGMTDGGDLQNIAQGLIAPMVKRGVSPEVGIQFAESLKSGTVSIHALRDALKDLDGGAKATRQTIDAFAESVHQYGQAATGLGATSVNAINAAKGFSSVTGQSPTVAAGLLSSPVFQSIAMARYGVMPENIGTLPGYAIAQTQMQSIERLKGLYPSKDIIDPTTKEVISTKEEQQVSFISKRLNMSPEQVEQTLKNKGKLPALVELSRNIGEPRSNWNKAWTSFQGRARTRELEPLYHKALKRAEEREGGGPGKGKHTSKQEVEEEYARGEGEFDRSGKGHHYANLNPYEKYILRYGGPWEGHHVKGLYAEEKEIRHMPGVSKKEVEELAKAPLEDKQDKVNKILQKRSKANIKKGGNSSEVLIGLTAQAARALRVEEGGTSASQKNAYAGGASTTSAAVTPQGPE